MKKYRVLEKFSQEARERAAVRVYDRRHIAVNVCADGLCVMGALLLEDGKLSPRERHETGGTPTTGFVYGKLNMSYRYTKLRAEVRDIMNLNDDGKLATSEAVRALLLGE